MKKIQKFLLNGLIMTATSLAMNLIGVWFSVYISNKIGTEAMGLFQLIMSVYSFSVTIATSGIHLAATRLVAEELGHNRPQGSKRQWEGAYVTAPFLVSAQRCCFTFSQAGSA